MASQFSSKISIFMQIFGETSSFIHFSFFFLLFEDLWTFCAIQNNHFLTKHFKYFVFSFHYKSYCTMSKTIISFLFLCFFLSSNVSILRMFWNVIRFWLSAWWYLQGGNEFNTFADKTKKVPYRKRKKHDVKNVFNQNIRVMNFV